ncbi:MAG: hypothetical protein ACK4RV_10075 [Caulobacter sp.]
MADLLGVEVAFSLDQGEATYEAIARLRFAQADWFDSAFPTGQGWLVEAIGGPFGGRLFALTSRWTISLRDQMLANGRATVVLHTISMPRSGFEPAAHAQSVGFGTVRLEAD